MSNVNLDYMLRQAQANVNANKNNAAHQAQVQAQAKAAQERQAYVEEHKNTYSQQKSPVLPTQPKQEPQQNFADLTVQQKLDALMRNGNKKTQPQTQPTKYYTVGAELQHDDIDPHWTTYKPVLPSKSLLPYKPTKKLTSADIATPIKPTAQQKFDSAVNRGILIADATPKKAIANFETLWNTVGNQLGKGITLQTQKQELESRLIPQNTKEPSQTWEELKATYESTPETSLPVNEKAQTPQVLTYGEAMQKQADENLKKAKEGLGEGGQMAVDLASSLSDMAFGMGTAGALGISSAIPIFAAQSAADGIEEAKANGATEEEAFAYGVLKGGLTAVTEKLVAGIPMTGKSLLSSIKPVDDAITKVTAKIAKSPTGAALIKRAFDVLGEGAEEVLETAVTPFLQRMTYDEDASLASKEDLLYSAVMGALASAVFNAPGAVADTVGAVKSALPRKTSSVTAEGGATFPKGEGLDGESMEKQPTGVFDPGKGTINNPATAEDVSDYVDYALFFSDEKQKNQDADIPKQKETIVYGVADDRLVNDIKSTFGVDLSGMYHVLGDNDIRHINNSHGSRSKKEKYPVTAEDLKAIPDIVTGYDDVLYVPRKDGKSGIFYVKRHNGTTYYLEQIRKGNILQNKQMIKTSTGEIPDVAGLREAINKKWNINTAPNDPKIPRMYVQDVWSNVPDASIAQTAEEVNTEVPTDYTADKRVAEYTTRESKKTARDIRNMLGVGANYTSILGELEAIKDQYLRTGQFDRERINSIFDSAAVFDEDGTLRESYDGIIDRFENVLAHAKGVYESSQSKTNQTPETENETSVSSTAELKAAYAQKKKAQNAVRTLDEAVSENKVLLSEQESKILDLIKKGAIEASQIPQSINRDFLLERLKAQMALEQAEKPIAAYNAKRKDTLRDRAQTLLTDSAQWKDKQNGFAFMRETMERNVRDMVKDKKRAEEIVDEYFEPVHKAEAERTRFKNEMRDRVRKLNLSEKESVAVQYLGEMRGKLDKYKNEKARKGRTKEAIQKDIEETERDIKIFEAENSDLDMKKIDHAIETFRTIYNELFSRMNDVHVANGYEPVSYRKNYFPHFSENKPDALFEKVAAGLGIQTDLKELPVDIAGRTHTFKPGKQWFGNAQQRVLDKTDYDAVRGFDKYIEGISNVIFHTENIQKLRAFASEMRATGTTEAMQRAIDEINEKTNLTEDEKQTMIAEVYDKNPTNLSKFVQELEEYTNLLAGKKSRLDRGVEKIAGRKIYSMVKNLENRTAANMVAFNIGSWSTNAAPIARAAAALDEHTMASAMRDTFTGKRKEDDIVNKSTFLTNRWGSKPISETISEKIVNGLTYPMEMIDHFTAETIVRAKYAENIKKGMNETAAIKDADRFAAEIIADRSKGALPTIFESKNPLIKLFTMYQVEVNNDLSWLFKDMPRREREKEQSHLAAKFMWTFVMSMLVNDAYEKLKGSPTMFDPVGIVNDLIGDATGYELPNIADFAFDAGEWGADSLKAGEALPWNKGNPFETEKQGVSTTLTNLGTSLLKELPFVGGFLGGGRLPISSAIPDGAQLIKLFDPEVSAEKKWNIAGKELLGKPAAYMALPFGGGQIKKTVEGLKAVNEGGSYTIDNEGNRKLQYPVFKENDKSDILPYAKAAVFGKSSLPTAKDWVDSGFKTKSVKFTQAYDYLAEQGINTKSAYDFLETFNAIKSTDDESSTEQKRAMLLADETMTPEQKAKIDDILLGSKWDDVKKSTQTAIVNARVDDTTTDADKESLKKAAAAALDRIEQVRGTTDEETLQLRREALEREDTLSDEQKDIVRYKLLDGPVSYESAIEHRRSTDSYQNKAKIAAFGETGGSVDDFYSVYDQFKKVKKNDEETAIEQKRAMLLADDTLTPEQKTKLDELLLNSKKPVSYESEAEHRRSLATESQQEKIAGFENVGGTVDAYYKVYDAFKSAEGDSALPTAQKKKNVYNALPTKYQRIVDETPKDENLNALKSYLLQSMSGLTDKEKQYLDSALIGNDIMPMERTVTYGNDSAYALSALGESWVEKYNELASPAKIDADTFVKAYYAAVSATWAKGENGAKSKAVKAAIDAVTPGMTKEKRRKLYEANGVGKTYW